MKQPVPVRVLAMPASKQAWPNSALCWSPAMPPTRMGSAQPIGAHAAKVGAGRVYLGQHALGDVQPLQQSASHWLVRMLNSMVRAALLTSVACTAPPVGLPQQPAIHRAKSQFTGFGLGARAGHLLQQPGQLGWRKVRVDQQPGLGLDGVARPWARSWAQGSPRRSCQTMALCSGSPVRRFHSTVVSRWLVMPTAWMSCARSPAWASAARRIELGAPDLQWVVPTQFWGRTGSAPLRHGHDLTLVVKQ